MSEESQASDTRVLERQFMHIAQVPQFQPKSESFENYIDRLTAFFEVNKASENEKVSTLIAVIGANAYAVLKYNLLPEKPTDKRYVDLIEILKKHYSGELILSERFKFNRRSQLPTETIAEYILTLKQLSVTCNYGEFLDQVLRDRLIAGLNDEFLINKLLAGPVDMSFTQASKICLDYETSSKSSLKNIKRSMQVLPSIRKVKSQRNQQNQKTKVKSNKLKAKSNIQHPINKSSNVKYKRNIANKYPIWKSLYLQRGKKEDVFTACEGKDNVKTKQEIKDEPNTSDTEDTKTESMPLYKPIYYINQAYSNSRSFSSLGEDDSDFDPTYDPLKNSDTDESSEDTDESSEDTDESSEDTDESSEDDSIVDL